MKEKLIDFFFGTIDRESTMLFLGTPLSLGFGFLIWHLVPRQDAVIFATMFFAVAYYAICVYIITKYC